MKASIHRSSEIEKTPRVVQVSGLFDVPLSARDERSWDVELPIEGKDWNIGLLVGPSGSGKSTLLREMFGPTTQYDWDPGQSVLDGFPSDMGVKDVTASLSAVGFSSAPSWMRPYQTLSNGEQFRVDLARTLVEAGDEIALVDEFTSVVDRTVAQVGSAAVSKWIRRENSRFVAASCHYDIIPWLRPDWVYDLGGGGFSWECLQPRPPITLTITRCDRTLWKLFSRHHYLSSDLHNGARCYLGTIEGRPACFVAVIPFVHPKAKDIWRAHRTVCLPDFQGVGIGNAMSAYVGSLYRTAKMRYRSVTASPGMIRHRAKSPLWVMDRTPGRVSPGVIKTAQVKKTSADRFTASFQYVGPGAPRADVKGLRPLDLRVPFTPERSVTVGSDLAGPGSTS